MFIAARCNLETVTVIPLYITERARRIVNYNHSKLNTFWLVLCLVVQMS